MSETLLIRHCSPTLAGMKTGSMFTVGYTSIAALREDIRALNRRLTAKGLRMLPLRIGPHKALIYLYRPSQLKKDLADDEAWALLTRNGYTSEKPMHCIVRLIRRLQEQGDFPHEIGLFLGYPPQDVRGFIEDGSRAAKCDGPWKVYGNEQAAQRLFEKYRKCTAVYTQKLTQGRPLERLAVAG